MVAIIRQAKNTMLQYTAYLRYKAMLSLNNLPFGLKYSLRF